jgi:hypothetical protein
LKGIRKKLSESGTVKALLRLLGGAAGENARQLRSGEPAAELQLLDQAVDVFGSDAVGDDRAGVVVLHV